MHYSFQFYERTKNSQERLSIILDLTSSDTEQGEEGFTTSGSTLLATFNFKSEDTREGLKSGGVTNRENQTRIDYKSSDPLQEYEVKDEVFQDKDTHEDQDDTDQIENKEGELEFTILDADQCEEEYLIEDDPDLDHQSEQTQHFQINYDMAPDDLAVGNDATVPVISEPGPENSIPTDHCAQLIFKCTICDKLYDKKASLTYHLKTKHTEERSFKCEICGKGFAIKADYTRHSRIHTGEKRYCCSMCGKKFTDRSTQLKHLRTHDGQKPHKCDVCGKAFAFTFVLRNHMLTHTGEKDFDCPMCRKAFSRKAKMKDHMKRIHKRTMDRDGNLMLIGNVEIQTIEEDPERESFT